jgi:hypothetical protein
MAVNLRGPRDPAGSGPADLLADIPAGSLGRDRGGRFFTTEVGTPRGPITYDRLFVLDLRRENTTPQSPRVAPGIGESRSAGR